MALNASFITNTATISTTEYSLVNNSTVLASNTTPGIYQVFVDFSNLATNDDYTLRVKEKTTTTGSPGSTQRIVYSASITGAQFAPVWAAPSLFLANGWDVTLQKIAGTDRALSWSIRQVA